MRTAVAAHQEELVQKKAQHAQEKEVYERSRESAEATSSLWSPQDVQPRTKNPKKRLWVESAKLIQQMWEAAEAARKKDAEEDPPPPQEKPEQEATLAQQELTIEKEQPFINQPEKPTPLFLKITIIELPKEKRKIKAPKQKKKSPEVVKQNIFLTQPHIPFILEQLEVSMPSPSTSSFDKFYDIIELESGDLELHKVQKPQQALSPTPQLMEIKTELPFMEVDKEKMELVAKTTEEVKAADTIAQDIAVQIEKETDIDETIKETIQEPQGELVKSPVKDIEATQDIELEKSPPRNTLKGKEVDKEQPPPTTGSCNASLRAVWACLFWARRCNFPSSAKALLTPPFRSSPHVSEGTDLFSRLTWWGTQLWSPWILSSPSSFSPTRTSYCAPMFPNISPSFWAPQSTYLVHSPRTSRRCQLVRELECSAKLHVETVQEHLLACLNSWLHDESSSFVVDAQKLHCREWVFTYLIKYFLGLEADNPITLALMPDFFLITTGYASIPNNLPGTKFNKVVKVIIFEIYYLCKF
ncbi:hypothetical protein L7F22_051168 [Adiantum nelumboides]|nr:hypothetical protein [Adiantum nelumboides]